MEKLASSTGPNWARARCQLLAFSRGETMKKLIAFFLALACVPVALAVGDEKEVDRVKDAGEVLKEILNIPDDIPRDLLDRAECVIVLPSVKKLAIGIGGSYGRGV